MRLSDLIEPNPVQAAKAKRGKKAHKETKEAMAAVATELNGEPTSVGEDLTFGLSQQSPANTAPDTPSHPDTVAFAERMELLLRDEYPAAADPEIKQAFYNVLNRYCSHMVARMPSTRTAREMLEDYRTRWPEGADTP